MYEQNELIVIHVHSVLYTEHCRTSNRNQSNSDDMHYFLGHICSILVLPISLYFLLYLILMTVKHPTDPPDYGGIGRGKHCNRITVAGITELMTLPLYETDIITG